jgi:hypothetical protein
MTAAPRPRFGPASAIAGAFALAVIVVVAVINGSPVVAGVVGLVALIVAGATRATRPGQASSLVEPNQLGRDRIEASLARFFERVDRLPSDQLDMLAVRPLDAGAHRAAVSGASEAVTRLHREDVLARADEAIEVDLPRRLSGSTFPSLGVVGIGARLSSLDRVRLTATLRDAALAVIARDAVDEATFAELVGPCADLVSET